LKPPYTRKLAQYRQHKIQNKGEKYYTPWPRKPPYTRKVAQKRQNKIQSKRENYNAAAREYIRFEKSCSKGPINRVLGKIQAGSQFTTHPGSQETPPTRSKNIKQGRNYNTAAGEYIRFEKTWRGLSTESLEAILSRSQFLQAAK
jgi:hypothetical protein